MFRGPNGYTLSGEIDLASMTFSSEATWPEKSIKLTTHYENGVLVKLTRLALKPIQGIFWVPEQSGGALAYIKKSKIARPTIQ